MSDRKFETMSRDACCIAVIFAAQDGRFIYTDGANYYFTDAMNEKKVHCINLVNGELSEMTDEGSATYLKSNTPHTDPAVEAAVVQIMMAR